MSKNFYKILVVAICVVVAIVSVRFVEGLNLMANIYQGSVGYGVGYGEDAVAVLPSPVVSPVPPSPRPVGSRILTSASVNTPAPASVVKEVPAAIIPVQPEVVHTETVAVAASNLVAKNGHPVGFGATGGGVKALQVFLNASGFTVSSQGAGSPGRETSFFGPLTRTALSRFQASNGITSEPGYFGPITQEFIKKLISVRPI